MNPYAARRRVENDYLVRQRDQRRLRDLAKVSVVVLLLGGGLWAYTWMHIDILHTGYQAERLEQRLHELLELERRLRLEAVYRERPALVESRARQELGMSAPIFEQIVFAKELLSAAQEETP